MKKYKTTRYQIAKYWAASHHRFVIESILSGRNWSHVTGIGIDERKAA